MIITDIVEGKRNKERVNIYIDEEYAFSLYLETAILLKIKIGSEITQEQIDRAIYDDERKYALDTALKFISYRMRSKKEVEKKLREKDISGESSDYAIEKLIELGYIDDEQFARLYVEQMEHRTGTILMRERLMEKGISKDIISEALKNIDQSELAFQKALLLKEKYKNDDKFKVKQKVFRSLMTKGFDFEEIKSAVAKAFGGGEEYYD